MFAPPHIITNAELVETYNEYVRLFNHEHADAIAQGTEHAMLKSSDEFIVKASGIKQRHVMSKDGMLDVNVMCPRIKERADDQISMSAEIAVAAARDALAQAHRTPADIDGIIVSASTMQRAYPQIAIEVQKELGITGFGFDMLTGCSSATFAIQVASDMISQGSARTILCINPEICTGHLNLRDRETHFIFVDACTATVLESSATADGDNTWEILGTRLKSVFSNNIRNNFGTMNRFDPQSVGKPDKLITQKGRKVFKEVVPMVAEFMLQHLADMNIKTTDLKRLWLHQANINMNELIGRRVLGRDPTPQENVIILDEFANTSSAGSIIAFHRTNGDFAPGETGLICSFGAGYSIGALLLRRVS